MRIAIVSDIHEDIQNLERAFVKIHKLGCDIILCLGDITGYAPVFHNHQPDANACIDLLRNNSAISITGNHDLFSVGRLPSYHGRIKMDCNWYSLTIEQRIMATSNKVWIYQDEIIPELTPENHRYLAELEEFGVLETQTGRVLFSHFLEPDITGATKWFPFRSNHLKEHFAFMNKNNCNIAICAHGHQNGLTVAGRLFWSTPGLKSYKFIKGKKIIMCPPIVSGKGISGFVIFDISSGSLQPIVI